MFSYWTPYRGLRRSLVRRFSAAHQTIEPLIGGLILIAKSGVVLKGISIEPLIGGLIPTICHQKSNVFFHDSYWTPYRGIEMLICFPWKGSGGGVVYGCGVLRVKSWVKNVLNTNKYIAISPIKWGWSRLTYLPLVFIISEKSIILFYWTPYRGDWYPVTPASIISAVILLNPYRGIDTLGPPWFLQANCHSIEPLIGGLRHVGSASNHSHHFGYWTPYRGIDTQSARLCNAALPFPIEPLIGGLRLWLFVSFLQYECYWTPYRGIDISLREWAISNEKVGIKCSFAFLERGAVEEVFTGVECGEWRVELKTFLTQTNISQFFQ